MEANLTINKRVVVASVRYAEEVEIWEKTAEWTPARYKAESEVAIIMLKCYIKA